MASVLIRDHTVLSVVDKLMCLFTKVRIIPTQHSGACYVSAQNRQHGGHSRRCVDQNYCLNDGVCYFIELLQRKFCE